jgi:dimethylhistidine N-methyltransferase
MSARKAVPSGSRLKIRSAAGSDAAVTSENTFASDVRAGLTARPKKLLPKYFYDALGSHLFEAICQLPEYYPTRAETEIFERSAPEIVSSLNGRVSVVELGSGSSVKTRLLIEALIARQGRLHYQPIDISATMLEQSAQELLKIYPELQITAQACDYTRGLGTIERAADETILALFLGSNIGNYDPPEAIALLRQTRRTLRDGDGLLLGADLKKPTAILEAAYDDALGVTAAFNLNVLLRINRELGADFNLKQFRHRAIYNHEQGRIEMHLVSRRAQKIHLNALGLTIEMQEGETIHTENSYKYDLSQLNLMAEASGFSMKRVWMDAEERFSSSLWLAS